MDNPILRVPMDELRRLVYLATTGVLAESAEEETRTTDEDAALVMAYREMVGLDHG